MLKEETLEEINQREYEEPNGKFLEMIGQGSNTITVLTRVDSDKVVQSSPVDPSDLTVSEIKDYLRDDDYDWNDASLLGLLKAEQKGKDRTTAINAIEEKLE